MPTDAEKWEEQQIMAGKMPDKDGKWCYVLPTEIPGKSSPKEESKDSLENRVHWEIGFLRTVKILAQKQKQKEIKLDFELLKILTDLLEECEEYVRGF